jgi:hypothetical protein
VKADDAALVALVVGLLLALGLGSASLVARGPRPALTDGGMR